ncbi:hypothetical protein vseg_014415 [Gypsophila vaccaria]
MESESPPNNKVIQHVPKASSDQLLRKFAEVDSGSDTEAGRKSSSKRQRVERRKKKKTTGDIIINVEEELIISPSRESNSSGNISGSLRKVERKSLLCKTKKNSTNNKRRLVKQLGISRSHHHPTASKHKFVFCAIQKTWSKVLKGASKVFMEKHYNRHRILNSDIL